MQGPIDVHTHNCFEPERADCISDGAVENALIQAIHRPIYVLALREVEQTWF